MKEEFDKINSSPPDSDALTELQNEEAAMQEEKQDNTPDKISTNDEKSEISEKNVEKSPSPSDEDNSNDSDDRTKATAIKIDYNEVISKAEKKAGKTLTRVKDRVKQSDVLKPEVIKDMFFGSQASKTLPEYISDEELEEEANQQVLFDKKRKRYAADPDQDKIIFTADYMISPDQMLEGFNLFYHEFIRKSNIRWTILFLILALGFAMSIIIYPDNYVNYLLLLISLSVIALKWITSYSAKKQAHESAGDVKNDNYRLIFYSSRIVIEESELAGDKIYNYPPVMIRFEDIDLKVIDYEQIYVLIFKKDYIYTIPKSSMTEQEQNAFETHLKSILRDDYHELYKKMKLTARPKAPIDDDDDEEDLKEKDND